MFFTVDQIARELVNMLRLPPEWLSYNELHVWVFSQNSHGPTFDPGGSIHTPVCLAVILKARRTWTWKTGAPWREETLLQSWQVSVSKMA